MIQYSSNYEGTLPFTDACARIALQTNSAQTYTIPPIANFKKYVAVFEYTEDSNVFVGYNTTATVPGAGTSQTTGRIEFRPDRRYVVQDDVLSVITPDAGTTYVGISLYAIPG